MNWTATEAYWYYFLDLIDIICVWSYWYYVYWILLILSVLNLICIICAESYWYYLRWILLVLSVSNLTGIICAESYWYYVCWILLLLSVFNTLLLAIQYRCWRAIWRDIMSCMWCRPFKIGSCILSTCGWTSNWQIFSVRLMLHLYWNLHFFVYITEPQYGQIYFDFFKNIVVILLRICLFNFFVSAI